MEIKGKYYKDHYGFTNVFTDDTVYTLVTKRNWGSVSIGQPLAIKGILTKEVFEKWKEEAIYEGTFELIE